ncbi:MAG TPA: TetR family transcriptional regulator [Actinomycetota bacterium]|nr:TetR family transcriptional regulator [Actinomycetota bacterium]
MSATGLRERNRARTHGEILEAALDLFETEGFDATTIEDIAAAAEVSPRTFFRYFDSKVDVVVAVSGGEAGPDEIEALIRARPPQEHPARALLEVMRNQVPPSSGDDPRVRQYRIVMATPSLRAPFLDLFQERERHVAAAFAARLRRDPDDIVVQMLAAAAVAALRHSFTRWVAGGAKPGQLWPSVEEALTLLEREFRSPARAE